MPSSSPAVRYPLRAAALLGLFGSAAAFHGPATTQRAAVACLAESNADFTRRRLTPTGPQLSLGIQFEPAAADAATAFMHGIMVMGASETLRDAGAACVATRNLDVAHALASENADAGGSSAKERCAVLYMGPLDDVSAVSNSGAGAAVVDCADMEALEALQMGAFGDVAVVPRLKVGSVEAVESAALAAAGKEFVCIMIDVEDDCLGRKIWSTDVSKPCKRAPVVRVLPRGDDNSVLDARVFASKAAGFDGVFVETGPSVANPADLALKLASTLKVLRSKKSRTFGGFLVGGSTDLDKIDSTTLKWAKYAMMATEAGIIEQFENTEDKPSPMREGLDLERGDYKAF
ncbi:hypothetical protein M885DRAFT_509539 [Pelagophyceae sp. CCMP2097]|nr:hypothetical protein M885DRAFT_509539 [Pelagophyceae sp. CCMP2097]